MGGKDAVVNRELKRVQTIRTTGRGKEGVTGQRNGAWDVC